MYKFELEFMKKMIIGKFLIRREMGNIKMRSSLNEGPLGSVSVLVIIAVWETSVVF